MDKVIKVYTDGVASKNPGDIGVGFIAYENGKKIYEISRRVGFGASQEAKYLAVLEGLKTVCLDMPNRIVVYSDSQLVINQLKGEWKIKNDKLKKINNELVELVNLNPDIDFKFKWDNKKFIKVAKELANQALTGNKSFNLDNESIDWMKDMSIGNKKEVSKLPCLNPLCLQKINEINAKYDDVEFRELESLKVHGTDSYSYLSDDELKKIISIRFGDGVVLWLEKMTITSDVEFRKNALRWTARGLFPNLALKKARSIAAVNSMYESKGWKI